MTKISDVMTRNVRAVRRDEPLSSAAKLMWDADCGAVPVLDERGDQVVGMITDRDICMATWSQNRSPTMISIASVMSRDLCYCSPDEDLAKARELMRSRRVRRIPILDSNHHLAGILSLADLVRKESWQSLPGTLPNQVVSTIAEICNPRHVAA